MAKQGKRQKPTPTEKQRAVLKEAIVLIPLTYNDGTPIPQQTLDDIHEEAYVAFSGWTLEGTVQGAYRMEATGEKQVEYLQKLSVVLPESKISKLEAMIGRWAKMLGQETMLLKVSDFRVKFIEAQGREELP
jgi:hypothetical protein